MLLIVFLIYMYFHVIGIVLCRFIWSIPKISFRIITVFIYISTHSIMGTRECSASKVKPTVHNPSSNLYNRYQNIMFQLLHGSGVPFYVSLSLLFRPVSLSHYCCSVSANVCKNCEVKLLYCQTTTVRDLGVKITQMTLLL